MNLIATRGQFSPKQKAVNLMLLIKSIIEELKIVQRNGVELVRKFPEQNTAMTIGDWELLKKAFTNLLLNAIQSLPSGKGRIEILVMAKYRLRWALERDYDVFAAATAGEAKILFSNIRPPVVTLDLELNPENPKKLSGMRLLGHFFAKRLQRGS